MKRTYTVSELPNPVEVLRKAGYSYFRDPQSHEESFVLRLTSEFYPRFHLYIEPLGEQTVLSLHLDQKKPSYGNGHAHAGEYNGSTVEREMKRIDSWVRALAKAATQDTAEHDMDAQDDERQKQTADKIRNWFKNLFR